MVTEQPSRTNLRTALSMFLTGLLLGALVYSLALATGLPRDAMRFILVVMGAIFVLRYALPLKHINWLAIIGVVLGFALMIAVPNLSLSSLGTEQLLLILGILWLILYT